jgi:hypothetical protein
VTDFIKINDMKHDLALVEYINFKSLNLFSEYYKEYYQESFTDLTFVMAKDSKILGHVLCCILDGKLTLPDGGIIVKLPDVNDKDKKELYNEILCYLELLEKEHKCNGIIIKNHFENGILSFFGEQLLNRKFKGFLTFEMEINYENFSEDLYHRSIRRCYKSFINWGKKELKFIYINKDNLDFENFKNFQDFHYKISGRKTRSDETWLIQYEMIKEGFGELILARYNDNLVAGSLFADYGDISAYFTGVYERDLFDFGVSHSLLYQGICRSHERGNTSKFSLGYFDTDIKDPKWYNIQFFKKGFCEKLVPTVLWSKKISEVE